jgi:O-antigen ligase
VSRAIRLCDGALEAGLVALMVLAPLPEGSVRSLAQVMIVGGVALLLALSIVRMSLAGELRVCLSPVLWPGLAMAGLVGWQLLSSTGSVDPHATRESARLFFAYLGLLLVVSMLPMTRARATRLMGALLVSAVILAGLGFARQIGFAEAWLGHPTTRLTSTFINPNHQALYFSLALFVSLGLVLRPSGRGVHAPGRAPRRNLPVTVLLVGGLLFLALALVLTLSRGGVVSTMAGLFAMLVLVLSARSGRRSILPVVAVALAVVTYSGWVGLEAVADRFTTVMREPVSDLRLPVWKASLRVVSEAPVTGIGLGAFQDGFRPFRPADVPAEKVVDYAASPS